jgi:preprotein translocase subunit SecE
MVGKVRQFVVEVAEELKKVSWTTRQDLIDSTWVVLVSSFCLGIFIWASDTILSQLLRLIIKY